MYRVLHPEDNEATEDTLTDVTIKNVLVNSLYNDLGFIVGNRLMILVEAQSTWTLNILIRILLYLAESYNRYYNGTRQNLYGSKKVIVPKPELYVIYTGKEKDIPKTISFSEEFFNGAETDIEIKAKVICESDRNDIINQYIIFCKVFNEQVEKHGRTKKAVEETIRVCKDRDILKEYLKQREKLKKLNKENNKTVIDLTVMLSPPFGFANCRMAAILYLRPLPFLFRNRDAVLNEQLLKN